MYELSLQHTKFYAHIAHGLHSPTCRNLYVFAYFIQHCCRSITQSIAFFISNNVNVVKLDPQAEFFKNSRWLERNFGRYSA